MDKQNKTWWELKEKDILDKYGDAIAFKVFWNCKSQHEKEMLHERQLLQERIHKEFNGMVKIEDVEKAIDDFSFDFFEPRHDKGIKRELKQSIRKLNSPQSYPNIPADSRKGMVKQ